MFCDRFKQLCEEKGVSCNRAASEIGLSNATPTKWKKTGAMAKYASLIEIDSGWLGKEQYLIKGASAKKIVQKFESVQDIPCLIEMGRSQEDATGQQSLDQLEAFYDKYQNGKLTVENLAALKVSLSIGSIVCLGVAVGDEEISALRSQYPGAICK